MTNQATVRSTGTGISTKTSTNTCICTLENASIVRTLFDLFFQFSMCPDSQWNRHIEYWAIHTSARSFARTAHSFACSALLAALARSTTLIRSLARSRAHRKVLYVYEMDALISFSFYLMCKGGLLNRERTNFHAMIFLRPDVMSSNGSHLQNMKGRGH